MPSTGKTDWSERVIAGLLDPRSPSHWVERWLGGAGPAPQAVAAANSVVYVAVADHRPFSAVRAWGEHRSDLSTWRTGRICTLAVTADGRSLVAGSDSGEILVFGDWTQPHVEVNPPITFGPGPAIVAAAATAPVAAVACGGARVLDTIIPRPNKRIKLPGTPTALALSPDGTLAFVGFDDCTVASIDLATRRLAGEALDVGFPVAGIGVSPTWPRSPIVLTGRRGEIVLL